MIPTALGVVAKGRSWKVMGPWDLGRAYRPMAIVAVAFSGFLVVIGVQPPNDRALSCVAASIVVLGAVWFGRARRTFQGPPREASSERVTA